MTDLDAMSALAWALCAVLTVAGFAVGAWRRAAHGRACYAAALVNHGVDKDVARAEAEWWYRPGDDELEVEAFGEICDDCYAEGMRDVPPAAGRELGDDGGGEGASGVLAGSGRDPALALDASRPARPPSAGELDPDAPWCPGCGFANYSSGPCEVCGHDDQNVPRPGVEAVPIASAAAVDLAGPGHQRGYGPYLAAIGPDDPAGWYANLTAGEPPPEPGPRAEPAWVERLLHQGAISTAWCEATLHDTAEYFRADEAAVDCQIERWVRAARFQLVGSRSWPPPELAGAP